MYFKIFLGKKKKEIPGLRWFHWATLTNYILHITPNLHNLSQVRRGETLPKFVYVASITLIIKPEKNSTKMKITNQYPS